MNKLSRIHAVTLYINTVTLYKVILYISTG